MTLAFAIRENNKRAMAHVDQRDACDVATLCSPPNCLLFFQPLSRQRSIDIGDTQLGHGNGRRIDVGAG